MLQMVSVCPAAEKYHEFKMFHTRDANGTMIPVESKAEKFESIDGAIKVPSGSGLGVKIDPDYIKVDMTLVRDIHTNAIKKELIATIYRFAESTGITLIAEGVEKREELDALRDAGVRFAQGYLFARPESPPSVPDLSVLD